jgi:hypothetical protein
MSLALTSVLLWASMALFNRALAQTGPLPGGAADTKIEAGLTRDRPPAPPPGLRLAGVGNGDFETGPDGAWTEYSVQGWPIIVNATQLAAGVSPHSGSWAAWLGGDYNELASITQTLTIPANETTLSFWHWIGSEDACNYDFGRVLVNNAQVVTISLCVDTSTGGWVNRTADISAYAGQNVELQFRVETDSSLNSNWFIDDVSLGQVQWQYVYLPVVGKNFCGFSYFDDFSNPNSGWYVINDAAKTYAYVNGEYQMLRKYTYDNGFSAPDLVLPANYRVEVDARQPSTAKDSHGLVFGLNTTGETWETYQFYELLVYPPSQVFLLEKKDERDNWTTLIDWTYSPSIYQNSSNRLRVDRAGTRIDIYLNDTLVYTFYDGSFTGAGRGAGLRVYSGDSAPVDTRFDNFSATCLP